MRTDAAARPLDELHRCLDARWRVDQGVQVPGSFGDAEAEVAALRQGLALWDASSVGRLEMLGEDRHRFLNGMVTSAVVDLEPGQSRYGLFTNIKGRILADVTVIVHADRIWLRLPPGRAAAIREHMERFVITDRVELASLDHRVPLVLAGPRAEPALEGWMDAGAPPLEPTRHVTASVAAVEVCLVREERLGTSGFSLWIPESRVVELATRLLEADSPPTPVGLDAMETVRVTAGLPRYGVDFGDDTFPQEADLDEAVSYEKGCYLGQEVVARIHFRGGVNRVLRGLELGGSGDLVAGAPVSLDGREVGRITSAARLDADRSRALAMIAVAAADAGTLLATETGAPAEVAELPFDGV